MSRKIGRNDPCPCGSGKKYKRCCLPSDQVALLDAATQEPLWAAEDLFEDDDFEDDDSLEYVVPEDIPPFDFAAIELIRYERGFVASEEQVDTGEGLRATEWRAPDIPKDLLDSLALEGLDELDGPWGSPAAANPIQVDAIHVHTPDDDIIIEIRNRGALLRRVETDEVKRLHRVCGVLEAAADRGVDVPAGYPAHAVVEAGPPEPPAFGLDDALRAHRKQKGTCELCGAEVTGAGASRHLAACAPAHDATSGPRQDLIHLRVTAPRISGYWLDVEVRADAKLAALDGFLRDIWVECCGHLSGFDIGGVDYASRPYEDPLGGIFGRRRRQRSLSVSLGKALAGAGDRFTYEYDYGSTTRLQLVVRGSRSGRMGRTAVRLLARNQPLEWPCGVCGEPAASVCSYCIHESANPFVCAAHAERHPCEGGDGLLPVVNSPRMGVCGYG